MNKLYVNRLIWHLTNELTIRNAVQECIEQGIWDIDQSAECELRDQIDQQIDYNKNYKVEPRFQQIEITVDNKIFCWCDIRTLETCLEDARYHYPSSFIKWQYCE